MIEERKKCNTPSLKNVLRGLGVLQSGIRARYNTRPRWARNQSQDWYNMAKTSMLEKFLYVGKNLSIIYTSSFIEISFWNFLQQKNYMLICNRRSILLLYDSYSYRSENVLTSTNGWT
jgi:hypothetical protein